MRTMTTCSTLARSHRPAGTIRGSADGAYANRELYRVLVDEGSDRDLRREARGRRRHRARRSGSLQARGRGAGRGGGAARSSPRPGPPANWPRTVCLPTSRLAVRVEVLDPAQRPARRTGFAAAAARARDCRSTRTGGRSSKRWPWGSGRAARGPASVRLRRGRRRDLRQRVSAAAPAARRSSATGSSTRRSGKARSLECASAPLLPASVRSARCSSTTSSQPASTSW